MKSTFINAINHFTVQIIIKTKKFSLEVIIVNFHWTFRFLNYYENQLGINKKRLIFEGEGSKVVENYFQ